MSNLGMYKTIAVAAKKVGGPSNLLAAVAAGGYVVLRSAEAGSKKAVAAARKKRSTPCATKGLLFTVTSAGTDIRDGLTFRPGESFRVLECDGDAILIEVLGNPTNPYFVSGQFLATISTFPASDAASEV